MDMGTYTIRELDEKTKETIRRYAEEHDLNIAEALRELVLFASRNLTRAKKEKKYGSFFDIYGKARFRGGKSLSEEHDRAAYGL